MRLFKGILFDYGGTIDTDSIHWFEVFRESYAALQTPIDEATLRQAYVYAERQLAIHPYVKPTHTFRDVLRLKTTLQAQFLGSAGVCGNDSDALQACAARVEEGCYARVLQTLERTRPVLQALTGYRLALVTNFYGNMPTVLKEFGLTDIFPHVVESAVAGVRKPDPAIYHMGVEALGLRPDEVLVVGDSFDKDIVPARKVGCAAVWLKGKGWNDTDVHEEKPDGIIHSLTELPQWLRKAAE